MLNNREIASALWLFAFVAFFACKAEIRKSFVEVVQAFFRLKILVGFSLMLLYISASVFMLSNVGLWKIALLKDTVVWVCISAFVMMMRFSTSDETENIFMRALIDNMKIVIVMEFLLNTYTFSLPVELIIVPVLTLLAMLDAVAGSNNEYQAVQKITCRIQAIIGFAILAVVLSRAIADLKNLQNWDTVRGVILTPLLSLLFLPFLYMMTLISKYELVFLRLDLGIEKDDELKRYARRCILMHVGLSLRKIQHLLKEHALDLMGVQTKADIECLVHKEQGKSRNSARRGLKENVQDIIQSSNSIF